MFRRTTPTLLLAVFPLTACTTTFDISPAQTPCASGGKVRTLNGGEETLREKYSVELIPHPGAVLLRTPDLRTLTAVPAYDVAKELARGFRRVRSFEGPLSPAQPGSPILVGPPGSFAVRMASVERIRITQVSPGKRAVAVVVPSLLGAAAVAVLLSIVFPLWKL